MRGKLGLIATPATVAAGQGRLTPVLNALSGEGKEPSGPSGAGEVPAVRGRVLGDGTRSSVHVEGPTEFHWRPRCDCRPFGSAVVRSLKSGDIQFVHLQHRVRSLLGTLAVGGAEQ